MTARRGFWPLQAVPRQHSRSRSEPQVRVLIIEDDHDTRRLFTFALELAGHDVATATNGAEGLSAAQLRRPDVIRVVVPGGSQRT